MRVPLLVLCFGASTLAQAPAPVGGANDVDTLPLQLLNPATGALCLDGSAGGFHARNGSKTSLMLSLPGGGWCWDDASCGSRAATLAPPARSCAGRAMHRSFHIL